MNCNSAEVRLLAGTGSVRLQRKQNTRLSMTVTQPFQYDKSNESPVAAVARGVGASVGCARHGIGSFVTIKKTTNILPRVRRWATSCVDTGDWCAAQSFFFLVSCKCYEEDDILKMIDIGCTSTMYVRYRLLGFLTISDSVRQ